MKSTPFVKKNILFLLILINTLAYAQPPQEFKVTSPQEAGFSEERLNYLDRYLQDITDKGMAPNAVSIVIRNGNIVHYKAFGYSNLESKTPVKKDDIFRIASQTKAIVTAALLTLFEEGKFGLDDHLSRYIPEFKNPQVLVNYDTATKRYTTRPAKSEITIRQLLSHTSGIPYQMAIDELPEFNVPFLYSVENETLADIMPTLAKRPLLHDPGEKFVYGLGTDVAGYLIEVLSGQSLDVFLKERIFDPLGMVDTHFYLPPGKANRLVELYAYEKPDYKLKVNGNDNLRKFPVKGAKKYFSGGAGLVSTALDYARFLQMILNGGTFNNHRILSRKTIEIMSRNQIGDAEVWDRNDKFGLGFQIITPESRYGDLASVNSLTWGGAYCSEYTIDPSENLVIMVLTNVMPYSLYSDFVRRYRTLVYQGLK